MSDASERLQCPDFPYDDPGYFRKFDRRTASYGYNITIGPSSTSFKTAKWTEFRSPAEVFAFTDAIHFDFNAGDGQFNEGHYVIHNYNASWASGYAHFRHQGAAQMLMMDMHVASQVLDGPSFTEVGGGEAGNLTATDGTNRIYDDRNQ